jgi:hypothetical protein
VQELRPGLFRWTARHPDWEADAEPESPADWPAALRVVLDLPVELVSHGEPVLEGGYAALATILDGHAQSSAATAR